MSRRRLSVLGLCIGLALPLAGLADPPGRDRGGEVGGQGTAAGLHIGSIACGRVLYLGNSITLHGPAEKIGWTGNWGMAASSEAKDYVHLLTGKIAAAAGGEPQVRVKNIAAFERTLDQYDVATELKEELAFRPELVIVAIGENVAALKEDADRDRFRMSLDALLKAINAAGARKILVRSNFWVAPEKDAILRESATAAGATFVDLGELGRDPSMMARSERKIEHDGVAGHPGDKGMKAIADALWAAIEAEAKAEAR